ncbi:hypothetical protein EDB86DRAFT_2829263 [Lactarius hatsudake]|nr:hypothetical protein EDB86DRAFT_2829263 [Lactarius hatsudake]
MSDASNFQVIDNMAKEQIKYEIIFSKQAQVLKTDQTKFNEAMAKIQQSPLIAKQGQRWEPTPDKVDEYLLKRDDICHPHTPFQVIPLQKIVRHLFPKLLVEPRHITNEELQLFQNPENLHRKQFILSSDPNDSGLYEVIGYSRKQDRFICVGS